jgi:hypothetical protein
VFQDNEIKRIGRSNCASFSIGGLSLVAIIVVIDLAGL